MRPRIRETTALRTSASSGLTSSAGLGRRDLQQRDELAGGGQPVLGDAVVAELAEFFEPDAV